MDLKRALEIKAARTDYLGIAANRPELEAIAGDPVERYKTMQSVLEALVTSHADSPMNRGFRKTWPVTVAKVDGPLPKVKLLFSYEYHTGLHAPRRRDGYNEFGEYVESITATWMHAPDGRLRPPAVDEADPERPLIEGETFATETIRLLALKNGNRLDALEIVEQSLAVYVQASEAHKVAAVS